MIREHVPVHRDSAKGLVVSRHLRGSVHAALAEELSKARKYNDDNTTTSRGVIHMYMPRTSIYLDGWQTPETLNYNRFFTRDKRGSYKKYTTGRTEKTRRV